MKRTHTFHKENCNNNIRNSITDILGRTVVLSGIHAFEWKITIISGTCMTTQEFNGRKEATKEFNKFKRRKR
jgi:hypothetical protein